MLKFSSFLRGKESDTYGKMYFLEVSMATYISQSAPEQKENIIERMCETQNRAKNIYVHIKGNLTTNSLIIFSLSLNLSCRQLIRCVSSDLDSHFLESSSKSLSLFQRKCRSEKTCLDQVREIPELYLALNSKPKIQGHSQAFLVYFF